MATNNKNAHGLGCMLGIRPRKSLGNPPKIHPWAKGISYPLSHKPATHISTLLSIIRTFPTPFIQYPSPNPSNNHQKVDPCIHHFPIMKNSTIPRDKEPRTSRCPAISPDQPLTPPHPKCRKCRCPLNHTRRRSGRTSRIEGRG